MKVDRIIPTSTSISSQISCPISGGFVRSHEDSDILQEIDDLKSTTGRVVLAGSAALSGAVRNAVDDVKAIQTAQGDSTSTLRFDLLLHWTEALELGSAGVGPTYHRLFVIVDQPIDRWDAFKIQRHQPQWILMPRAGLDWKSVVSQSLLPEKRGEIWLWAPPVDGSDGPYLSADELRLRLDEMQLEHPLIKWRSVPQHWHVVSERGIEGRLARSAVGTEISPTQEPRVVNYSLIVPVKDVSDMTLNCIRRSIQTMGKTSLVELNGMTWELIICLDHTQSSASIDDLQLRATELSEFTPRWIVCTRRLSDNDWRAGWLRQQGALKSRCQDSGALVFFDSDVELHEDFFEVLGRFLKDDQTRTALQYAQLSSINRVSWKDASSRAMIVRRSAYDDVRGFSEAFFEYGCEDNALSLELELRSSRMSLPEGVALPPGAVSHRRTPQEFDRTLLKMHRLGQSASLFYRMYAADSVGPEIHSHFYSSLARRSTLGHVAFRASVKRLIQNSISRTFIWLTLFFLTLFETDDRTRYLAGLFDRFKWSILGPLTALNGRFRKVYKENVWKLPVFFSNQWIRLKATRWGWAHVGWRLRLIQERFRSRTVWRFAVYRQRVSGFFARIYGASVATIAPWPPRLAGAFNWTLGLLHSAWGLVKMGWIRFVYRPVTKIPGVWSGARDFVRFNLYHHRLVPLATRTKLFALRPLYFLRGNGWRLNWILREPILWLRSNAWFFSEPTIWFKEKCPRFYRWIWRPLLKARYFIVYQIETRFRKDRI